MEDDAMKDAKEREAFAAETREREDGMERLREEFMKPDIRQDTYVTVETRAGTEIVLVDAVPDGASLLLASNFQDYCEGKILDPDAQLEIESGWLARLSAPGYLDCTDWTAHASEIEAQDYLIKTYLED